MRRLLSSFYQGFFYWKTLIQYPELRHPYSIASHLTLQERFQLFKLAKDKKWILEIGSYTGASAACFGAVKKGDKQGAIYCIDTWNNDAMTEGKKDTYHLFFQNIYSYNKWIVPIRGFSTDVVEQVRRNITDLDLLFIDGDHSYEGVKADWEFYKGFLKKGSTVIFHDIGWAEGVCKVIKEDVLPFVSTSDSLPNMWWGIIKDDL